MDENWTYVITSSCICRFNEEKGKIEVKRIDNDEWVESQDPDVWRFASEEGRIVPIETALNAHKHFKERLSKHS